MCPIFRISGNRIKKVKPGTWRELLFELLLGFPQVEILLRMSDALSVWPTVSRGTTLSDLFLSSNIFIRSRKLMVPGGVIGADSLYKISF